MNKKIIMLVVAAVVGAFTFVQTADALRITLKRVVFEGPKRAEVITIINNSEKPKTYRLGWRHYRMTENESLVAVPEDALTDDIKPVVDMVRFAPRRFTVAPKSSQQVRMMLRMPANLPDGEYRSHFWVRPEADVGELKAGVMKAEPGKTGVSLQMLAGVTMPVIVRKGALQATASIPSGSASRTDGFVDVSFVLEKQGNRSLYGDLDFTCNPGSGGEYILRTTRGIAIYAETALRNFNIRIEKMQDKPSCNTLSITYSETDGFDGDKVEVLAQHVVNVN